MTEHDKRISDQLIRLVQIVFGMVLAQSLALHRDIVLKPFSSSHWLAAFALAAVYITTVLSWIDWHITMELRPYNFSARNAHRLTEQMRLGSDLLIVTIYAYLLFSVEDLKTPGAYLGNYLLGFPIIFGIYLLSGLARRVAHGKRASNPTPILAFGALYAGFYVLYISAYAALRPEHVPVWNAASLSVALTLMILYRLVRRWIAGKRRKQKVKGLTIGVDIDGVLANQIHGLVPRVRARLGIDLEYEDVIEWRLPLGKSNIAREIEEAFDDSDYISTMPVHTGARDLVDSLYENNLVTLITARPESTKAATQQWLQNHGFSYDQLVNVKEQKKSLYRSAVLVDDYLGNVEEYLRNTSGIAILVEQPWNRTGREHLDEWALAGRLHVVTRLVDIPMIVDGIRKRSAPAS